MDSLLTLDMLAETLADDPEPRYPWYLYRYDGDQRKLNIPRTPSAKKMLSWADDDEDLWTGVLDMDTRMLRMYRRTIENILDQQDLPFKDAFTSPDAKIQVDALCSMLSGLEVRLFAHRHTTEQVEHAMTKQEAGRHLLGLWQQRHRESGNGPLAFDMTWCAAIYGRIVILLEPEPRNPDFPFHIELCDPGAVFVSWGADGQGISRATRKTSVTIGEVIEHYDPTGNKGLYKKLQQDKANADKRRYGESKPSYYDNLNTEGELKEVWTRWHKAVFWDDLQVQPVEEHATGYVPIIVVPHAGEFGPSRINLDRQKFSRREIELGWGDTQRIRAMDTKRYDLASKFGRFLEAVEQPLQIEAAMVALMMTKLYQEVYPPQITQTPYFASSPPERTDLRPNAHTIRRMNETTQTVQLPQLSPVGPLVQKLTQVKEQALLPSTLFGVTDGSSASGFQENTLIAAAKQVIGPYINDLEVAYQMVLERAFYLYHGWGHNYVDNEDGIWAIPAQDPMAGMAAEAGSRDPYPRMFELSREVLDTCGFAITVELHSIDWRELTAKANAAAMLLDKGVWSIDRAMREMDVENVMQEREKVISDMMLRNQQFFETSVIPETAMKMNPSAYASWMMTVAMPRMLEIQAQIQQLQQMVNPQMGPNGPITAPPGGPPGGSGPPGSGPPPTGPPQTEGSVRGVQTAQGDSQAMVGSGQPGNPRRGTDGAEIQPGPGGGMRGQAVGRGSIG